MLAVIHEKLPYQLHPFCDVKHIIPIICNEPKRIHQIKQLNHQSVFYPQTHTRHFRFIISLKRKKLDDFFFLKTLIHAFNLIHDLQILPVIKMVLFLGNIGRHSISVYIPSKECSKFCKSFVKQLGDLHVFICILYAVLHKL